MYETMNQQMLALGKQFTDNLVKVQSETLKTLEQISSVQMKALETQAANNAAFASEAGQATDAESLRALWEKGADFSRDAAEKTWAAQQNVLELLAKNAETIGTLAREQYEAGNEAFNTAAEAVRKPAKAAKAKK